MTDAVAVGDEVPADLLDAFRRYEAAIMSNDLDVLDAAFAPGPSTMRGDPAGLLVGHHAISAFRGTRGGVPARVIERVEVINQRGEVVRVGLPPELFGRRPRHGDVGKALR